MVEMYEIFRTILLRNCVLEMKDKKIINLEEEKYGVSYENPDMRIECHDNSENDSSVRIKIFNEENGPINQIIVKKEVKEDSEIMIFGLVYGTMTLAKIEFKYNNNGDCIRVIPYGSVYGISFTQDICNNRPGITRDNLFWDDKHFFGVDVYSTEFMLEQIHEAACNFSDTLANREFFVECVDNMFEVIKPALVLSILEFNKKFADMIKDYRDDYETFLDTLEAETSNKK